MAWLTLAVWWMMAGCGPDPSPRRCDGTAEGLVVTTTDYTVGALATLNPAGKASDELATVSGDPLVVVREGHVLQLNRGSGDGLRVYRPGCWRAPEVEIGLVDGANPHDAMVVGDQLVVSQYGRDWLSVRSLAEGFEVDQVDLSSLADGDGLPEADTMVWHGQALWVGLQRLDRGAGWADAGGQIAAIDTTSWTLSSSVDAGPNPKLFAFDERRAAVLTGMFFDADGALRLLDLSTGELALPLVDEASWGLDLTHFVAADGIGVLLGVDVSVGGPSRILCVDVDAGRVVEGPSDDGWFAGATLGADGLVYVAVRSGWGDGSSNPGVMALEPSTCLETGRRTPLSLEPYSIASLNGR
jgi:hypothetical protein